MSKRVTCLISTRKKSTYKHSRASKVHFLQRFYERVGYRIADEEYDRIQQHVKDTGRFLYRRENDTGAVYGIRFNDIRMKVVYDAFSNTLITVLPI